MTELKNIKRESLISDDKSEGNGEQRRNNKVHQENDGTNQSESNFMALVYLPGKILGRMSINSKISKFKAEFNLDNVVDDQLEEEIEKRNNSLHLAELEYKKNKMKKWMTFAFGLFIGLILGIEVPKVANFLFSAKYDRSSLDALMKEYLGKSTIDQVLSNEVLIVSYEYNS